MGAAASMSRVHVNVYVAADAGVRPSLTMLDKSWNLSR
jgi:hypothetical protein